MIGSKFKVINTYEQSIKKYFLTNWFEFDALLFEFKYSKTWLNEWWLKKLVIEGCPNGKELDC